MIFYVFDGLDVGGVVGAEDEDAFDALERKLFEDPAGPDVAFDGLVVLLSQRLDPGGLSVDDQEFFP